MTFLREHAATVIEEVPFVQIVAYDHYRRLGRTDAQHIFATLPDHPDYRPDDFNNPLDCRIIRSRDEIKDHRYHQILLQIKEIGEQNHLRNQRTTLLNHMSEGSALPDELARGFRVPLARIWNYTGTLVSIQNELMSLVPNVVTLGPVQVEPGAPAG